SDDYLSKPFHPTEFALRVKALLRRTTPSKSDLLSVGNLRLDCAQFKVEAMGQDVSLRPAEFRLLEFLMRHPGEVFSSEALLARVWSSERDASPDSVRMCVARLRSKLSKKVLPGIVTVPGAGYCLRVS